MIENFKLKAFRVVADMRSAQNRGAPVGNFLNRCTFFHARRG